MYISGHLTEYRLHFNIRTLVTLAGYYIQEFFGLSSVVIGPVTLARLGRNLPKLLITLWNSEMFAGGGI